MATMKLKTTKGELVDLLNGLFNAQDIKGKEFALAVSKNISTLNDYLSDIEEMGRPSEEFMKFAQEIRKIHDAGDKEKVDKMEKENAALMNERNAQIESVKKELKKAAKVVELEIITRNMFPQDINARQISSLEKIIK